jgi:8-oxo-dGTP diphosphatase
MLTTDPELETDRLRLRRLQPSDAPVIAPLVNDWEVARYTSHIPHPYTVQMADEFIAAQAEAPANGSRVFAVLRKDDDVLVGCVGLHRESGSHHGEIGYWIGRQYWGQGYASEAVRSVVDYAFNELNLAELEAGAVPVNRASHRVLAKAGFIACDVREEDAPARGHPLQLIVRRLKRARWHVPSAGLKTVLTVVAVALVDTDGRVLLAKRPEGKPMAGLWEFPGGKIQDGESPEEALIRELREELGINVKQACLAPITFASHEYEKFFLLMPLFVCRRWEGQVTAKEGQELAWVRPAQLKDYPMPPADVPLIPTLIDLL